ncbi:hypothetical protein TNCV_484321 [Trichonephila clavipes]|nr:hypothetical protein TNCV_484321 [Trichonephila clavipes]
MANNQSVRRHLMLLPKVEPKVGGRPQWDKPEETVGRQREIAEHTTQVTGRRISRCLTVAREDRCTVVVCLHDALYQRRYGSAVPFYGRYFMSSHSSCRTALRTERLAARTLPPVTIRELRLALQDEWASNASMLQQLIDTLILSMGRRCETCLAGFEMIEAEERDPKTILFLAKTVIHQIVEQSEKVTYNR